MADFVKNPKWEVGIRQLETSDPVLAGPDGPDNIAPRQLANRTVFLKEALDHLFGLTNNNDGSLNKGKLVLPVNRGGTGLSAIGNGQFIRGNNSGGFTAITSDQLIKQLSSITFYDKVPNSQVAPVIYLLGRGYLEWQTIGEWSGYASLMLGSFLFDTTRLARQFTIPAAGGNFSKTTYPALYAWAKDNGHMVGSSQWKTGEYKFVDIGGNLFKVPDLRNVFIRATGTNADNANARALGSHQQDALQNITGRLNFLSNGKSSIGEPEIIGAFRMDDNPTGTHHRFTMQSNEKGVFSHYRGADFDASRAARTSTETRSSNTALAPRIIAF